MNPHRVTKGTPTGRMCANKPTDSGKNPSQSYASVSVSNVNAIHRDFLWALLDFTQNSSINMNKLIRLRRAIISWKY